MDEIEIPDERTTSRTRLALVKLPSDWVSPYTPEQALGIALFNNMHTTMPLDECCEKAKQVIRSLKPMGFTVEFTGV